ncbi:hypothetical protein HOD20_06405, partial [archaeon]|nr:hypothetical protein [archaeon]
MSIQPVDLIKIIGSPFIKETKSNISDTDLISVYDSAFENRVGLLYLQK